MEIIARNVSLYYNLIILTSAKSYSFCLDFHSVKTPARSEGTLKRKIQLYGIITCRYLETLCNTLILSLKDQRR